MATKARLIFSRNIICSAILANCIAIGGGISRGAATSEKRDGLAAARRVVSRLLRKPAALALSSYSGAHREFFFRMAISLKKPQDHFSMLVACRKGRVAVVVYRAGLPYSYFSNGIFAIVSSHHPGTINVYRGASLVFFVGGTAGSAHRKSTFSFLAAPILGSHAKLALNLVDPLKSALTRPARTGSFNPVTRTCIFYRNDGAVLAFRLARQGRAFPIASMEATSLKGRLTLSDITIGPQPPNDVFGISVASLRSLRQPVRVRWYRKGENLAWFPPLKFGSKPGEILASDALAHMMPINEERVHTKYAHLLGHLITMLGDAKRGVNANPRYTLQLIIRIFSLFEWVTNSSVDAEAHRVIYQHGHPARSYLAWNFNRVAYHRKLEEKWGKLQIEALIRTLVDVAQSKDQGPLQKYLAVDLISDLGPGRTDRNWADNPRLVRQVFKGSKGNRSMARLLRGLIRARWDRPITANELSVAKRWLLNPAINIPNRVRALEILCFANKLPDDRRRISKLVKAYLSDPVGCIAAPTSGRYLLDLSLCRTGREILLQELADRHSQLAGEPLLPVAAYNNACAGSPGFKMAIATALRLANDLKQSPQVRRESYYEICRAAPGPVFRKFMMRRLDGLNHFSMSLFVALTGRKAAGEFAPQLTRLFLHGDDADKVRILQTIGLGFAKGGNANGFAPIIASSLQSQNSMVRWAAIGSIVQLENAGAKLDVAAFYRKILETVQTHFFHGHLREAVGSLNCFAFATNGRWSMPKAGMHSGSVFPNLEPNSGRLWWEKHYATVRQSALQWARTNHVP